MRGPQWRSCSSPLTPANSGVLDHFQSSGLLTIPGVPGSDEGIPLIAFSTAEVSP